MGIVIGAPGTACAGAGIAPFSPLRMEVCSMSILSDVPFLKEGVSGVDFTIFHIDILVPECMIAVCSDCVSAGGVKASLILHDTVFVPPGCAVGVSAVVISDISGSNFPASECTNAIGVTAYTGSLLSALW